MNLTERSEHFEFGQNWQSYTQLIDEQRVHTAVESVSSLAGDLSGKTFLDIGSGSGLFSLAALKLGAARVLATDIDENSIAASRKTLGSHPGNWDARVISVFDLPASGIEQFDVVYSWGVLHHTGAMWRAIECASKMVRPGGLFAFALYEKTPLCGFWTAEKRYYKDAGPVPRKIIQAIYSFGYGLGQAALGRNPWKRAKEARQRGMDPQHDLHDWLGGFPYESVTPEEVERFLKPLGFERQLAKPVKIHLAGLFGSGCSEYVYRRRT